MWLTGILKWIPLTRFHISYIISSRNKVVDKESRKLRDNLEWLLKEKFLDKIVGNFGPVTIDLFAFRVNCKVNCKVNWLHARLFNSDLILHILIKNGSVNQFCICLKLRVKLYSNSFWTHPYNKVNTRILWIKLLAGCASLSQANSSLICLLLESISTFALQVNLG